MGGYGAIRFGMTHPDVFGSVYALHPVGTGSGIYTMYSRPDWEKLAKMRSTDELPKEIWANIFLSIFQAGVPDVAKPPLYVDLQARKDGDNLVIDSEVTERLREFGIVHEAEEYNGVWGSGNWGLDGRVATEVLPFFARALVFEGNGKTGGN